MANGAESEIDMVNKMSLAVWDRLYDAEAAGDGAAAVQLDAHGFRMAISALVKLREKLPPDLRGSPARGVWNDTASRAVGRAIRGDVWPSDGYLWLRMRLARDRMHAAGMISLDMGYSTVITNAVRLDIAEASRLYRFAWMTGGREEMEDRVSTAAVSLSSPRGHADDDESQTLQDTLCGEARDTVTLASEPEEVSAGLVGPTAEALHTAGYDWLAPKSTPGIVSTLAVSLAVSEKTVRNRVRDEFDAFAANHPPAVDWRGLRSLYPVSGRYIGFWHGLGEVGGVPALREGCYSGTPSHVWKRRTLWRPDLQPDDAESRVWTAEEVAAIPHREPIPAPRQDKDQERAARQQERDLMADIKGGASETGHGGMRLYREAERARRVSGSPSRGTNGGHALRLRPGVLRPLWYWPAATRQRLSV